MTTAAQMALDFEAAALPASTPAAPAEADPARLAAIADADWLAPTALGAGRGGQDALALACSMQKSDLAKLLLELPIAWDLDAPFDPASGRKPGAPTALTHLLAGARSLSGWGAEPSPRTGEPLDEHSAVGLAMVERGASFLAMDSQGRCALTLCAAVGREGFIQRLAGHPDFEHAKLAHLRVGHLEPGSEGHDGRPSLLSHLIASSHIDAARALVADAGFPVNEVDPKGRLPLGYCRNPPALDAMLALGADPALADASGLTALARFQKIGDASVREAMTVRIATELKKSARHNPSGLADLQRQNIGALLDACENSPKSSMLKLIGAFKFDPASARHPTTQATPLMAALKGGRVASARHLLERGCDINAADAQGVTAAAFLLAAFDSRHGQSSREMDDLIKACAAKIDFSARSARGWPVALEAAHMLATGPMDSGYGGISHTVSAWASAINQRQAAPPGHKFSPSWIVADDGTTLMEAYALGKPKNQSWADRVLDLHNCFSNLAIPAQLDRMLGALISNLRSVDQIQSRHGPLHATMAKVNAMVARESLPMPLAAATLRSRPKDIAGAFQAAHPTIYAAIEAAELAWASAPSPSRPKSSASRL